MKVKELNDLPEVVGLMSLVDWQAHAKKYVSKFSLFGSMANTVKFQQLTMKAKVTDIDDLFKVQRPCVA